MMNVPLADKWGLTKVNMKKCTYTWTISNFCYLHKKTGEMLESPYFAVGTDEERRWCLRLYLNGINENFKDILSLYLYRKSGADYELNGQYALSVLNNRGEKFMKEREECQYNKNYCSLGFPGFVKSEHVKDKSNGLLHEDSLTLHCEITIVTGSVNISSEQSKVPRRFSDGKSLTHLESLFLNERFSDVRLVARCGKQLHAHKNILAVRSPIFSAMFEHDMVERKLNVVEIADVDHDVLVELLRFVYTARVDNIESVASGLLAAADKYEIEGLKEVCEEVLCDSVSVDNVVEILVVAERHNIGHLKTRAMSFIKAHTKAVIDSAGFKLIVQTDILIDIMRAIIQQ